ncbi:hypothetical protein [Niabella beijingensis]|uniref:hypothetical protein n=1 Tax=Niabella beijingensis TaxID=2872700 RepID=UPI001CC16A89|nr:hypothetical protein [Niabella beijingensis]MBZ4191192.1 hypothetical protein [Niabella beijingensis]
MKMATYTIAINVPKAADILLAQLVRLLKEAAYTREVDRSSGEISADHKSIRWNIEGTVSFHDIHSFVDNITKHIQQAYSYSITHQGASRYLN